jgi:hypothetical protein
MIKRSWGNEDMGFSYSDTNQGGNTGNLKTSGYGVPMGKAQDVEAMNAKRGRAGHIERRQLGTEALKRGR